MADAPPEAAPRSGRWSRLAAIVFIGIIIAFAAWWLIRSDGLRESEHSRNIHEVDIAARLVESWPKSVRAMAAGNLLPSRIDAVHPAEAERGWQGAARFLHPRLGTVYIHYGVPADGNCPDRAGTGGSVAFDDTRPAMRIGGSLPVAELWYADQLSRADAGTITPLTDAKAGEFAASLGLGGAPRNICFKAELPLTEIVDLPTTAPDLEKLLLIDRGGNLLAQLGGPPLPMASVDELSRLRPLFDSLIDAAEIAASQGKTAGKPQKEPGPVVDLSAPAEVTIGGHSYFAYARTLNLPADFPATACKAADTSGSAAAKVRTCLVMGLVPTKTVNAASLRLSPAALTAFALLLGLLVSLLPLLKLRLIGPGDALRRAEVAAVALGIVTAVAIGTLTLLFAQAYIRDNQRAAGRALDIAGAMANDFQREFAAATARPFAVAAIPAGAGIEPAAPDSLVCTRPNGTPVTPAATIKASRLYRSESGQGWWPVLESSAIFGEFGMAWPGYVPVLNRCDRGTRANISQRPYFKLAMNGSPGDGSFPLSRAAPLPGMAFTGQYRVGAVRAQPDGIEKVIVAAPFRRSDGGLGPQRGAFVETFIARTFVAPVLPAPFAFMVVDAGDPALPVLFATNTSRIEVDRLADDISAPGDIAAIGNARCKTGNSSCGTPPERFSARYEGVRQHFVAQGLAGTPWVLLVHYTADAIASPIAEAAVFAASAWTGLAIVTALVIIFAAQYFGASLWQWSWPRPGGGNAYRHATKQVVGLTAAAVLACLMLLLWSSPVSGVLRLLIAIGAPIAAIAIIIRTLHHRASPTARFLDPADEAGFRTLAITLLLAIGALPMTMLWADSRESSFAAADSDQLAHVDRAIAANVQTRRTLMRAFGTDSIAAVKGLDSTAAPDPTGEYALMAADLRRPDASPGVGPITGNLRQWSATEAPAASLDCPAAGAAADMQGDARKIFCGLIAAPPPTASAAPAAPLVTVDFAWFRWFCFILLAIGTAALLLGALGLTLRSLFGHGVPLEAVNYPGITRRPDGSLDLPSKALVLNAPLALRLELLESWDTVDLSDPAGVRPEASRRKILVTGLALALRDPGLRASALTELESLSRSVDAAERAHTRAGKPGSPGNQIVVMTDLSPLDRILQAYESEQALASRSLGEDGRREQLRWSRLFEAFATIGFIPVSKVTPQDPADETLAHLSDNERRGVAALVNEVRDLPELVIDSLINSPDETVADYWRKTTRTGNFPFAPSLYTSFYDVRVRRWASRISPASRPAAIDYLRGTLIEHYQYIWIASSHAERIILDSLARRRTVNIASALALRSLVRRGLIRFAPIPRLMNDSFAAFVLQAEKPMQINAWRNEQPRSLWQRSALPLMIVVPAAIIGLVAVALYSGERAIGLMPLLLGSAPALIGTFGAIKRNS